MKLPITASCYLTLALQGFNLIEIGLSLLYCLCVTVYYCFCVYVILAVSHSAVKYLLHLSASNVCLQNNLSLTLFFGNLCGFLVLKPYILNNVLFNHYKVILGLNNHFKGNLYLRVNE